MSKEFTLVQLFYKIIIFTTVLKRFGAVPTENTNVDRYDFIVVGAGVAGCVLANRLSENGRFTVLLLHKGGYPIPALNIPALVPNYVMNPEYVTWYSTAPQKNAAGENGGRVMFPVSRVLGGGSGVNFMHFNRGNPLDYDNWANLTGDPSWSYANMLSYLKRVEDYKGAWPLTNQHGVGGPITVSRPKYAPGLEEWLGAGRSLGYSLADPNGPQRESFTDMEFSKRFGRRVSSYIGYVRPIINIRRNLKLRIHAEVRKILFESDYAGSIRASGVMYAKTSNRNKTIIKIAQARKEVIVSAGAIGSPTLLLRSGVGPAEALEELTIPVIKDLPVGKNLHDHPFVQVDFIIQNTSVVFDASRDLNANTWRFYNEYGDGPYSTQYGDTAQAFLTSSQTSLPWPDLFFVNFWSRGQGNFVSRINEADLDPGETPVYCLPVLSRPKSRGSVTLNATDVHGDPVIDFRYLEDPDDMLRLVEGIKKTLIIYEEAPQYQNLSARYNPRPLEACENWTFRSDEYWECLIRQTASTAFHGVGSCKMGADGSPDSVVNTRLEVFGISGLRVVDASVMPAITNANTQVPTYGIAEKASSIILSKWNF